MHVVAYVSAHYDHEPVPRDFDTSTDEFKAGLASGLVKVAAKGGYVVRVKRTRETHVTMAIPESEIAHRVLHHALPQNGSRIVSRRAALADYVAVRVLPEHAHPTHLVRFEVHDDGPDEAGFRAFLAPYLTAIHARSGEPIVPAAMLEPLVKAYLEPAGEHGHAHAHVEHLHAVFNLAAPAPPAPAAAPVAAVPEVKS
jgi:hypothetical protein